MVALVCGEITIVQRHARRAYRSAMAAVAILAADIGIRPTPDRIRNTGPRDAKRRLRSRTGPDARKTYLTRIGRPAARQGRIQNGMSTLHTA